MKRPTSRFFCFLCSLLLLLLAGGCGQKPDTVPPVPGESRVVIAKPGDPVGLDPANVTDLESLQVTRQIFDTLVQYEPDSTQVVPALAESWDLAEDGLSITFKLRKGVKFHDGTPFNAQAVKLNYDRQGQESHPLRSPGDTFFYWNDTWGSRLKEIVVVDDSTVRFDFTEPIAPLMQGFAMPFFGISSPAALKKFGADYFHHPVGTGPYKFREWLPGERLTLEANAGYWDGPPEVQEVTFLPAADSTARELRLRKGAVNLALGLSPQGVERLKQRASVKIVEQSGLNVAFVALNNRVEKLKDARVRKAIWHAVDRSALVRGLYYGLADVTDTALPEAVWGRLPAGDRKFDPEEGRRLMREAGYSRENPLQLEFWYMAVPRSYFPEPKATAEAIARMLEEVYIECDIQSVDWGVYLDRVGKGEHEMALAGWIGDHGDPDNYFSFIFSSANIDEKIGGTNVLFYSNPKVDDLISRGRREMDQAKREAIYKEVQEIIYGDAPWLPVAHARSVLGAHPKLRGYALHPTGLLLLHKLRWERS